MKICKILLVSILLLFTQVNAEILGDDYQDYYYTKDSYRGYTISYDTNGCPNSNWGGCYYNSGENKGKINISKWRDEFHYNFLLEHEVSHAIYDDKLNSLEKRVWELISHPDKLDSKLLDYGYSLDKEYATTYAKTNNREDYADTMATYIQYPTLQKIRKKEKTKLGLKYQFIGYIYNKYY